MYTYKDLIYKYALDVANGHTDKDLPPQERRLVRVMLNLAASATGWANVVYPPTDQTRDDVCKSLRDIMWNAGALLDAMGPTAHKARTNAHTRAIEILRNL